MMANREQHEAEQRVVGTRRGLRVGPYELGERLGAGGMAEVYAAYYLGTPGFGAKCAVKLILPRWAEHPEIAHMFRAEVELTRSLRHPNIVQVLDAGEGDGEFFMVLEYVDGVSCASLLKSVSQRKQRFPVGAALLATRRVLNALAYAHSVRDERGAARGIVHRDVSPGNILLSKTGEVKLTDFGIALSARADRHTMPGELKGKYGYMSPEQIACEDLDSRTDLFSLGVVLAEMLVGRRLFAGSNQFEVLTRMYEADIGVFTRNAEGIPKPLVDVVRTALSRRREDRFQNAVDFLGAIGQAADVAGISLEDEVLTSWLYRMGVMPATSGAHAINLSSRLTPSHNSVTTALPTRSDRPRKKVSVSIRPSSPGIDAGLDVEPISQRGVLAGDQLEIGLAEVAEHLATGTLCAADEVVNNERSRSIVETPELARFVRLEAYQFDREYTNRAAWREPIERSTLPSMLFKLATSEATGLLIARNHWYQKRVFWEHGAPTFVASTDKRELLGRRLVDKGIVARAELAAAVEKSCRENKQIGETLIELGLVRPGVLLAELIEQLEERVRELGAWGQGELIFVPNMRPGISTPPSRRSAIALLAQMVREHFADGEVAALLGPRRIQRLRRRACRISCVSLELTQSEQLALELAESVPSLESLVARLAKECRVHPSDTLRAILIAESAGMIEFVPG